MEVIKNFNDIKPEHFNKKVLAKIDEYYCGFVTEGELILNTKEEDIGKRDVFLLSNNCILDGYRPRNFPGYKYSFCLNGWFRDDILASIYVFSESPDTLDTRIACNMRSDSEIIVCNNFIYEFENTTDYSKGNYVMTNDKIVLIIDDELPDMCRVSNSFGTYHMRKDRLKPMKVLQKISFQEVSEFLEKKQSDVFIGEKIIYLNRDGND